MAQSKKSASKKTSTAAARKTKNPDAQAKRSEKSKPRPKRSAPQKGSGTLGIGSAAAQVNLAPPHFLVFLPGFMGSQLLDPTNDNDVIWIDPSFENVILKHGDPKKWLDNVFDKMQYPHPDPNFHLVPGKVVDGLFRVLPFQQHYIRLKNFLTQLGYTILEDPQTIPPSEPTAVCCMFPYDWRQDNRISAAELKVLVDRLHTQQPNREIWLMGHSLGGIVARWYLEQLGGNTLVKRLFLLASPWDGSPNAVDVLHNGVKNLFDIDILTKLFDLPAKTRKALRQFPSAYQIIPHARHYLFAHDGSVVDPYDGAAWLEPGPQIKLLQDAKLFQETLGNRLHVETLAFVGYNYPTTTVGHVSFKDGTHWDELKWEDAKLLGDGTVPQYSAEYNDAKRMFTAIAAHSDIYADVQVQARLEFELVTKYQGVEEGVLAPAQPVPGDEERHTVVKLQISTKDWDPGEAIDVVVTLQTADTGEPVTDATVEAQLVWLQELPLSQHTAPPADLPAFSLAQDTRVAGLYKGRFRAPSQEGYYELQTTLSAPPDAPLALQNKVVVKKTDE